MDILYLSILTRLKNNVPELRWIDEEQGQLETPEESYPVDFPCCLIDINSINWSNGGANTQDGDVMINFRFGFHVFEDTHKDSPQIQIALDRLKLLNKTHKYLHGWGGFILEDPENEGTFFDSHFKRLVRVSMKSEKRDDGLKVYNVLYKTQMKDIEAKPVLTPVEPVTLEITPDPPYPEPPGD